MHAVTQRTVPPCVWQLSEGHRRGPLRLSVMRRATTFAQQNQQQNQKNQVNPAADSFAVHESVADQKANTHSPPPPSTASSSVGGLGNVQVLACDPLGVGKAGSDIPIETHFLSSDTIDSDQTNLLEIAKRDMLISPSVINLATSATTLGEKMNASTSTVVPSGTVDVNQDNQENQVTQENQENTKMEILLAARAARPLVALPTWDSLCLAAPIVCTRSFIDVVWTKYWKTSKLTAKKLERFKSALDLCDEFLAHALLYCGGSPSLEDWDVCFAKFLKDSPAEIYPGDFFRPLDVSHKSNRKRPGQLSPRGQVKDEPCRKFRAGTCNKGRGCRFSH